MLQLHFGGQRNTDSYMNENKYVRSTPPQSQSQNLKGSTSPIFNEEESHVSFVDALMEWRNSECAPHAGKFLRLFYFAMHYPCTRQGSNEHLDKSMSKVIGCNNLVGKCCFAWSSLPTCPKPHMMN